MSQYHVMIAQFPYGDSTHPAVGKWLAETTCQMMNDPRIGLGRVHLWDKADTPVSMVRNECMVVAEENNVDFVVMVDSDMIPDVHSGEDGAKPFWETAFDFAVNHDGPCVIGAPYCGGPPHENVMIFRWTDFQTGGADANFLLAQYSRYEAVSLTGIERVAALPTGLMLVDMRAIRKLPHPRFYYEYKDHRQIAKASTEDVTFSRDLGLQGVPLYVAWDCWAGHYKSKVVVKPKPFKGEMGVLNAVVSERTRPGESVQISKTPSPEPHTGPVLRTHG
jgi:hypothetical protein